MNPNEQESSTVKNFGSSCDRDQSQMHLPTEPNTGDHSKHEKGSETEREKQSYSYHSAHEYQQHKNMVNNIKKEPFEEPTTPTAGSVKYEGYEKNYQNFIRYADFCDAQQPQQYDQKQAHYQQDFIQPQGYYNNYPYQNYPPPSSQNYSQQHSQSYQQFMSQQAAYQQQHGHPNTNSHHSSSLTNFEQQIPLHTYPIPKQTPTSMGETMFSSANIKVEPSASSQALHPSNENVSATIKDDCESFSRSNIGNLNDPCNAPTKNEVRNLKAITKAMWCQ